jgi:eukaryotic-like serine/threonine-protein kinase
MTPDRWAEVKRIFQAALDLPPAGRPAFVQAEAGDDDVRREVESLLASEETSGEFLSDAAAQYVPGALDGLDADTNLGRRIGPWRIEREIGAGGMGAVYLAERDGEFRQHAALKLMRPGMDSRAVVARFRYERQILAGLDHPNIARLLDGGASEDGRPYFVMEHVAGVPMDEYCRSLSLTGRLRVFLQVCAAVQYAHQNLIVHRDLKPGNILVTAEGVPKLLDFGIAKLLHQETGPAQTAGLTQMGIRLMTPEYASPEQIEGRPITTATDIYSLGVILYELLTGKPPYAPAVALTAEPPRPSTSLPSLKGDLDVILLKAIEKDPARRYASVEQFAGDIRRHLDGIPIVARPQTWRYRTGRFVRRNRVPVIAASLVLLSLSAGLIVSVRERARAQRNFDDLRRLTQSFLFDFHDRIKDLPGGTDARNAVLQTALDYLRRLGAEARGNAAVARDVAEAWLRLGDVQGNPYGLNRGDTAAALASYKEALTLSEDLVRRHPADSAARLYLARAHRSVGELLPQHGDVPGAVPHFRAAIAALETSSDPAARRELATCHESLGDVLGASGLSSLDDPAAARDAYTKALAIHESLASRRGAAVIRLKLGNLASDAGDAAAGYREYQQTAKVFQELAAADPLSVSAARDVAAIHRKLGEASEELGRPADAIEEYRQAAAINRRLMDADPENRQARMDYVIALKARGDLLYKQENYREALPLFREILGILGPMADAQPNNLMLRRRHTEMLLYVGDLLAQLKQPADARRLYAGGLRILKDLADRPTATLQDISNYADYLIDCPLPDLFHAKDAVIYAARAAAMAGDTQPRYLDRQALALFRAGNPTEAITIAEKALTLTPPAARKPLEDRLRRYRAALPPAR